MPRKKTSILIDAHIFDKEPQGTATYIKGIYNSFAELFQNEYEIFVTAEDVVSLYNVFPQIEKKNFVPLRKSNSFNRLTKELPRVIEENKIAFAHFQQIAPLKKNCHHIVTIHDLLFNDFKDKFSFSYRLSRNFLFKRSLLKSDIRLTVSQYSKDSIQKHYGVDNVFITHNAVQDKYFETYNKDEAINYVASKFQIKNYILYVSRIEDRKNHLMLLQAFRQLELYKKGVQLVFVGRNDIPVKKLEAEIKTLNEDEKKSFLWLQNVNDQDLMQIYKGAKLFVYPSLAEGFGIPPIEAGALQINTICSNTTAMKDFYFFGKNHFNPNNIEDLKMKMLSNLQHPPHQDELSNISKKIAEIYNWNEGAKIIHQLIKDKKH